VEGFFHVWFSTKRRKPVLEEEFSAEVKELLRAIARRSSIDLTEVEAVVDHVHMLLELIGDQTLSSAMHQLKGASAREIFRRYPEMKFDMQSVSFWQKGYGWRRLRDDEVPGVRVYIQTQRARPLRRGAG
jgi:putative transposase